MTLSSSEKQAATRAFSAIYARDEWALGSGPGSLQSVNVPFIAFLGRFICDNKVRSIVDFGCGDWQFMNRVDLGGASYRGLDVVDYVREQNRSRYGSSSVIFQRTPENLADLPEGDLILLKDVLIHLPNAYVAEVLACARRKFRFILAVNNESNDPLEYNRDIPFGGFRCVDISRPPFSIPCATILRYGKLRIVDPRLPWIVGFLRRRFVWPGLKHVQLALGERA